MPIHGITAEYKPFSFNDYMAPILMYQERYDKMQNDLASRYDEISTWKGFVDPNSTAGKTLTQYEQLLDQTAQDLATNGLKAVSRNTLFDLKRMYNSQISPIKDAAANYAYIRDSVRKATAKDPTIIVTGMPTIEDLMQNPNAYPSMVSGAALAKAGEDATDSFIGLTPKSVGEFLQGNYEAIPQGGKAILDIAGQYGNNSPEAIQAILSGMATGLGKQLAKQENDERKFQERIYLKQMSSKRSGGKGSGKGGGSTTSKGDKPSYNPSKGTVYINEDGSLWTAPTEKELNAQKSNEKEKTVGTKYVTFDSLSPKQKIAALQFMGADFGDVSNPDELEISPESLNAVIAANKDRISAYLYELVSLERGEKTRRTDVEKYTRVKVHARSGNQEKISNASATSPAAGEGKSDIGDTVSEIDKGK